MKCGAMPPMTCGKQPRKPTWEKRTRTHKNCAKRPKQRSRWIPDRPLQFEPTVAARVPDAAREEPAECPREGLEPAEQVWNLVAHYFWLSAKAALLSRAHNTEQSNASANRAKPSSRRPSALAGGISLYRAELQFIKAALQRISTIKCW